MHPLNILINRGVTNQASTNHSSPKWTIIQQLLFQHVRRFYIHIFYRYFFIFYSFPSFLPSLAPRPFLPLPSLSSHSLSLGGVHCALEDWAKFIRYHINAYNGKYVFPHANFPPLHQPIESDSISCGMRGTRGRKGKRGCGIRKKKIFQKFNLLGDEKYLEGKKRERGE